ncbi:MAG: RagB/SusD family nutrient uptake outer membrane protein [Marinifilaceae bacterium]|jgi:hypothetical protein|nr:RagB/SusD family nutrient uptake outer membrane protein [Marinifilaceae bacterium]
MKNLKYIILTISTLINFSCDDLLDTEPKSSISQEELASSYDAMESYLYSGYIELQKSSYYGRDFIVTADILADNTKIIDDNSDKFENESENKAGYHIDIWEEAYNIISRMNFVINNTDKLNDYRSTDENKALLKAQAYFLRALAYFDLSRVYSREPSYQVDDFDLGVPLITKDFEFQKKKEYSARAKTTEVYKLIESDLVNSIKLFNIKDNNSIYLARKHTAQSLLNRVYLYEEKWEDCYNLGKEIIDNINLELVKAGEYRECFSLGKESIFELKFQNYQNLINNSLQAIYMETESGNGYGDIAPTLDILKAMHSRKADRWSLIQRSSKQGKTVYYQTKYNGYNDVYGLDNIALIRLSEIYLNTAEAYAEDKRYDDARKTINILKSMRNIDELPDDYADNKILNEILLERRLELAFEGHRVFDLKRKGYDIRKEDKEDSLSWDDYRVVAKIPSSEIALNKNLKQNPKY